MISQTLIDIISGVWSWLWGVLPGLPESAMGVLDTAESAAFDLRAVVEPYLAVLQVWQPVPIVLAVLLAWVATWFASVGIKVVRMIVSLFSGGGGSVA